MARRRSSRGLTRIEVLVVVFASAFLLLLVPLVSRRAKSNADRTVCGANLATLGKAMRVYANDYRDEFPRAGGRTSNWGDTAYWDAEHRYQAFGLSPDGNGGEATISSCFYLLVKYAGLAPRSFVCPGDAGTTEFKLSDLQTAVAANFKLIDAWDFGPMTESFKHCSYAYHMPFGLYALKVSDDPALAVAADRNPWIKSPAGDAKLLPVFRPDLPLFKGTREQACKGNSISHREDGQNVLFVDGHVAFETRSYCGLDNDNIYLYSDDPTKGSPVGRFPVRPTSVPGSRRDSVLVHDPPGDSTVPLVAPDIDSKNLKQTLVVATTECPLPEHKNAIWCATFQMAWDKFKQDIVGAPIQIPAAQGLADRLNRSPFPAGNIEEKSYYAVAGFADRGIIEQIQKEMKRRFPLEPVPTFDSRYRTLPDVMLAYSYLSVAIQFERPFRVYPTPFDFRDSTGSHTGVTAFCVRTPVPSGSYDPVREQVEVLYHDFGQTPDAEQFAVDLSRGTQPYQLVVARLPRGNTLVETAKLLQERIAEFQNRPNHEVKSRLRPMDTLIVPDVLYKLTHHFDELLGKRFGNPRWTNTWFFEALQKIDFTLSRTGMVLRSEASLAATRGDGGPTEQQKPRHFHFDRPFLICVQKREPNATPFFLMWVDNAELIKPYGGG